MACSDNMVKNYKEDRNGFAIGVMNDPYYIEKTCGIHDLIKNIKLEDENDKDDF